MLGAIALAACSESENFTQPNLSTDKIAFRAATLNEWGTANETVSRSATARVVDAANQNGPLAVQSSLGCPLYLHPVEQVGIHVWNKDNQPITRSGIPLADAEKETTVATRGAKQTSLSGYSSFGVSAIYKKTSETGDGSVFFANQPAAPFTTGSQTLTWHIPDNTNYYWPTDGSLSFYAYAPHTDDATMVSVGTDIDGVKTIHYKASDTDITGQPDLIVASTTESRQSTDASKGVNLPFAHALTAVSFAVSSDLKDAIGTGTIDKVELVGVHDEGDCTLTATSAAPSTPSTPFVWSNQQGVQTYSFTLTGVTIGTDLALTSGDNTLMMIPQTLPDGAMVKFTFTVNGAQQVLSAPINGQEWAPGASVIYKLSAKAVNSLGASDFAYPTAEAWQTASYPVAAFDANEQIGLYVVDENNNVVEENIPVTKQADGSWTTAKSFLKLAKYKYFAYYPYSATKPTVTSSATTAEEFFKDKIDKWSPVADQSADLATLKAQDLQVAKGVVAADASTLTFPMAHKMGLAVLTLGSKPIPTTRTFTTDDYLKYYNADGTLGSLDGVPSASYTNSSNQTTVTAAANFEGTSNRPYKHTASTGSTSSTTKYFSIVKPSTATTFQSKAGIDNAWHTNAVTFNVSPGFAETKAAQSDSLFIFLARRYNCAGKVETFTAPKTGNYKLECWGASGCTVVAWNAPNRFGRGGYSYINNYKLSNNQILYVCVGGAHNLYNNNPSGLYSIEGNAQGGGATNITTTNRGELKNFVSYQDEVVVVAGAGGGCEWNAQGGHGGGLVGITGIVPFTAAFVNSYGTGGSQTEGGRTIDDSSHPASRYYNGSFGLGGCGASNNDWGAQGGSGWYGGGGSVWAGAAGGGSSYIKSGLDGNTIAGNTTMPSPDGGTETGHTGNGACNITWIP